MSSSYIIFMQYQISVNQLKRYANSYIDVSALHWTWAVIARTCLPIMRSASVSKARCVLYTHIHTCIQTYIAFTLNGCIMYMYIHAYMCVCIIYRRARWFYASEQSEISYQIFAWWKVTLYSFENILKCLLVIYKASYMWILDIMPLLAQEPSLSK